MSRTQPGRMVADVSTARPVGLLPVHALIFGGLGGVIGVFWAWSEHAFGFYSGASFVAALAFPVMAIVIGVQRWRDGALGGTINFSRAFGAALAIGLVYAVVVAAFAWLQLAVLQPGMKETLVAFQTEAMRSAGRAPDDIVAAETLLREELRPRDYAMAILTRGLLVSFVVGLLASVFVRRAAR